jgi:hypothetical protein
MAICRIEVIQPSLSSAVGASEICGPPLIHRPPCQRHAVLPANEPADPAYPGNRDDAQIVASADAVKHPLVHRRHQLSVPVQEAFRPDYEQRAVQRAGPIILPLVDPDEKMNVEFGACFRQPFYERTATSMLDAHIRSHNSSHPSPK